MTLAEFAKKNGYDHVHKTGKIWNGYEVYDPWNDSETIEYTGLPYFILKKGHEVRMCEPDECLKILDYVYPHTDDGGE